MAVMLTSRTRSAVVLPHGTGKTVRVLVFAKKKVIKWQKAEAAGADFVGGEELIQESRMRDGSILTL